MRKIISKKHILKEISNDFIKWINKKLPYKGADLAVFGKNDDGAYSIVLGERAIKPNKGKWALPGGGYDKKDSDDLHNTALREFEEETGIKITDTMQGN
jgi:ADP-ribose pyrophosphatase YjhB (NUDIX family)